MTGGEGSVTYYVNAICRAPQETQPMLKWQRKIGAPFVDTVWLHVYHTLIYSVWTRVVHHFTQQNSIFDSIIETQTSVIEREDVSEVIIIAEVGVDPV